MSDPPCTEKRLSKLEIHTWNDSYAWHACLREYDLGAKVFTAKTQREAIDDLLDYHEHDNGELHE